MQQKKRASFRLIAERHQRVQKQAVAHGISQFARPEIVIREQAKREQRLTIVLTFRGCLLSIRHNHFTGIRASLAAAKRHPQAMNIHRSNS